MSAANMFYGQKKPVNTADILSRSATASPAASQEQQRQAQPHSAFVPPPSTSVRAGETTSGPWNRTLQGRGEGGATPSVNTISSVPTTTWNGRDAPIENTSTFLGPAIGARPQVQKQKSAPRPGAILTGKQEHCMLYSSKPSSYN